MTTFKTFECIFDDKWFRLMGLHVSNTHCLFFTSHVDPMWLPTICNNNTLRTNFKYQVYLLDVAFQW